MKHSNTQSTDNFQFAQFLSLDIYQLKFHESISLITYFAFESADAAAIVSVFAFSTSLSKMILEPSVVGGADNTGSTKRSSIDSLLNSKYNRSSFLNLILNSVFSFLIIFSIPIAFVIR